MLNSNGVRIANSAAAPLRGGVGAYIP
jgi:hypothetical protein